MHQVILSLGTNHYQKRNLARARMCLSEVLTEMTYTSEIWTEPIGCRRKELYLNQLVRGKCQQPQEVLEKVLKDIEKQFGRTPQKRQAGIVPIDIDILEYDGLRYHINDWQRPYVITLLGEL